MPCAFIATSSAPLARPSTNRARNRVASLSATPGSTSVAASSGKPALITGRLPKRSTGAPANRVPTSRPIARPTSAVPSSPSDSSSDSLIAGSRGAHVPETVEWIRNAAETATRGELSIGAFLRGRHPLHHGLALDVHVRDDPLEALGHPPGALPEQGHRGRDQGHPD